MRPTSSPPRTAASGCACSSAARTAPVRPSRRRPGCTAGRSTPSTSTATAPIDKPALLARPALAGEAGPGSPVVPSAGAIVTTTLGEWSGAPIPGHGLEWVRCTGVAYSTCTPIAESEADGADQAYRLTADDIGLRVRSRVRAFNGSGTGTWAYSYAVVGEAARSGG